jgi:hypothetical protein
MAARPWQHRRTMRFEIIGMHSPPLLVAGSLIPSTFRIVVLRWQALSSSVNFARLSSNSFRERTCVDEPQVSAFQFPGH